MKSLLTALLCLSLMFSAAAQAKNYKLTATTVVKDSTGAVYPYAVWSALLNKGYSLKPVDPGNDNTEFVLFRLSDKQIADRLEKGPKPRESGNFITGKKINLFKTSDIDGNKLDLRDSSGKIIVLNFWFINCGPCRREIPELNQLVDSLKTNPNVKFYAIALDERAELKTFLEKLPFNYTVIDNGRFIANMYGIKSYPTHVVIDGEGKVYFHTVGLSYNTVYWLKKSINELLAQKNL